MASAALLILIGLWVGCQVWGGEALERLKIVPS